MTNPEKTLARLLKIGDRITRADDRNGDAQTVISICREDRDRSPTDDFAKYYIETDYTDYVFYGFTYITRA